MKFLEKAILVIFSLVIMLFVMGAILISTEMINPTSLFTTIGKFLIEYQLYVVVSSVIISIFALIGIFSNGKNDENIKSGLAIKHEAGTVYITKETFESIILNVCRDFPSLKNIRVVVNIDETGVSAKIFSQILPETVVPTVTDKLQQSIKEAVLRQTTVEIKQTNIKIKGVYIQPEKKI